MIKRFVVLLVFAITMSGDIGLLQDDGEVHTVTVDGFGSNLRFVPDTLTVNEGDTVQFLWSCLLYTSPSPRDISGSRMPSSA